MKIIVSSSQLLKYLANIQEFLKGDAKIRIDPNTNEFQIEGFKGLEIIYKGAIETNIPVQKLIELKNVLMRISDQPLVVTFTGFHIQIDSILI